MPADNKGLVGSIAPGLLSLLALKQQGVNPDALGQTIVPTVALLDWLAQIDSEELDNSTTFLGGSAAAPNTSVVIPAFANLIVPEGQIWYVHSLTWAIIDTTGTNTAMDVMEFSPLARSRAGSLVRGPSMNRVTTTAGSSLFLLSGSLERIWAKSGTTFGYQLGGFVVNAANPNPSISVSARITRLLI